MNKNYLHCKFRLYQNKEKGNFRFFEEKRKNILQKSDLTKKESQMELDNDVHLVDTIF